MPPRLSHSGRRGSSAAAAQQQPEASYEERVARVCALGCRLHQALLQQWPQHQGDQQLIADNDNNAAGAAGSSSGSGGGRAAAARGSGLSSIAASPATSGAAGGSGRAGSGSSHRRIAGAGATGTAAAGGGGGGLPRTAELGAAADDLFAIRQAASADPSRSTPDIFTAAHQRGQLHGVMALQGWCLRLAVPCGPPFTPSTCPGGSSGSSSSESSAGGNSGAGGSSGSGRGAAGAAVGTPPPPSSALAVLGTDNDTLHAAAVRVLDLLSGAMHDCATSRRLPQQGGPTAADKAQLLSLLVRCGCFELVMAALVRCCHALGPALTPPQGAGQQGSQQQLAAATAVTPAVTSALPLQRRVRLGKADWTAVWRWLDYTHDMIACAASCYTGTLGDTRGGRHIIDALRNALPDPAFGLKLLDCYSRTLLSAATAVAGGGGVGGGAVPAPQQADALARAMRFYADKLANEELLALTPQALEPHLAACPALSYALAAHAVHTCAAADGGSSYGLRCGPVAAAVAAAVAPGGALRFSSGASSGAGLSVADLGAGGSGSSGSEGSGGEGSQQGTVDPVLPLLGAGGKLLEPPPPPPLLQRNRHAGRTGTSTCSGSGGGGGTKGSSGTAAAAAASVRPLQPPSLDAVAPPVVLQVSLTQRAAELWKASLAEAWRWLLSHPMPTAHLSPPEQLRLCRTQPGCLRAAYARAAWLAEGLKGADGTSGAAAATDAAATAEQLSRRLAAARSCPLLHCGGAYEVGMRLAAAAAGCMAQLPTTAPEHRQSLADVQQLAMAAVAGRRGAAAGDSNSGCGGVPMASAAAAAPEGPSGQGVQQQPQPYRRLELAGTSHLKLAMTGLGLAREAWRDTSYAWMPKGDVAVPLVSVAGGSSSGSSSASNLGDNGTTGGVPYPPAAVQRHLVAWWRAALGWAALLELEYSWEGGSGGGEGGAGAGVVTGGSAGSTARLRGALVGAPTDEAWCTWRMVVEQLALEVGVAAPGSGIAALQAPARTAAAGGAALLPPLPLRPSPDVAAALTAGYLPVYGRLMKRGACLERMYLMKPRTGGHHSFQDAKAAVWAQLLVFGPPKEAQAFVAAAAHVTRQRLELFQEAAARQRQQQQPSSGAPGSPQSGRPPRRPRKPQQQAPAQQGSSAGGNEATESQAARAVTQAPAQAPPPGPDLARQPHLSQNCALSLMSESLDMCSGVAGWDFTLGLCNSLVSSGLLLTSAAATPGRNIGSDSSGSSNSSGGSGSGSSSDSSGSGCGGGSSGSSCAPSSPPLAGGMQSVGAVAAVAARVAAAMRAVATELLPAAADAVRTVAASNSIAEGASAFLVGGAVVECGTLCVNLLQWVPLLLRVAAIAPAAGGGTAQERTQQPESQPPESGRWRHREDWGRLLWSDIDLPALLRALCDMMCDVSNGEASAPAHQQASSSCGSSSSRSRSSSPRYRVYTQECLLPYLVPALTAMLQLAPLRLLQPPSSVPPPPPRLQPEVAAAGQRRGPEAASGTAANATAAAAAAAGESDMASAEQEPCSPLSSHVDGKPPAAGKDEADGLSHHSGGNVVCCEAAAAAAPAAPLEAAASGEGATAAAAAAEPPAAGSDRREVDEGGIGSSGCSGDGMTIVNNTVPPPAAEAAVPAAADGSTAIDVPRLCEHLRAWAARGDGPPAATHLAGVLESAAGGDWEAVRAKSRWLRYGAVVSHAPSEVAAQLWRQQRAVVEHGEEARGVPLEASVLDGALDAAAALLLGQARGD